MITFPSFFRSLFHALILFTAAPTFAAELFVMPGSRAMYSSEYAQFAPDRTLDEKYEQCDLLLTGGIVRGDLRRFHQLYDYWDDDEGGSYTTFIEDATLCLSSPGGDLYEALRIASFFRYIDADLHTTVLSGDLCASACSILFLAGADFFEGESYSTFATRAIQPGAQLGVHAPRIELGGEGPYSKHDVESAYSSAIISSAKIFEFSQDLDVEGRAYMNPYLYQRTLSTPPQDMYYIDTVGDAILGDVPVSGVKLHATLNETLIDTICDNAFMLDDGLFDWAFGPTWKRHPLASAKEIAWDFYDMLDDVETQEWDPDPDYRTNTKVEQVNHTAYGFKRGYQVSGPYYAQDCLVRIDTSADVGDDVYLANHEDIWSANFDSPKIQIMVAEQFPHGFADSDEDYVARPSTYWEAEATSEEAQIREYSALMAFPFEMPLAELPRQAPKPEQPPERSLHDFDCDELWYARNYLFHINGYCFGSDRGKSVFSNDECFTKSPELDDVEQTLMKVIKAREKELSCN